MRAKYYLVLFLVILSILPSCGPEKVSSRPANEEINLEQFTENVPTIVIQNPLNNVSKQSFKNINVIGKNVDTKISLEDFECKKDKDYTVCGYNILFLGGKGGRIHFSKVNLPEDSKLYVFDNYIKEVYTGKKQKNFWTVNFDSENVHIVFIYRKLNENPFIIDKVSYLWEDDPISTAYARPTSCKTIDLKCVAESLDKTPWNYAKSTSMIILSDDKFTYQCSGNLIAPKKDKNDPILITARHCFNDNDDLLDNAIFWFDYYNSECNYLDGEEKRHYIKGGKVLFKSINDIALIEIKGSLKIDKYQYSWLNWEDSDNIDCSQNDKVIGFSHPKENPLKYHSGKIINQNCYIESKTSLKAYCEDVSNANGFKVIWDTGSIDKGSSGSALLKYCKLDNDNFSWFIAGILSAKFKGCNPANGVYSNFFTFLKNNEEAKNFLENGLPDDKFEENDSKETAYRKWGDFTYKCNGMVREYNLHLKDNDSDWYEFFVPENCQLILKVEYEKDNGDIDIKIFDEEYNLLEKYNGGLFKYISKTNSKIYLKLTLKDDTYQTYSLYVRKKPIASFPHLSVSTDIEPNEWRFNKEEQIFYTNQPIKLKMYIDAYDDLYNKDELRMCIAVNSLRCRDWIPVKEEYTFNLANKKEGVYNIYIKVKNPVNHLSQNRVSIIYDKTPPKNGRVKAYIEENGVKFIWRKFKDNLSSIDEYKLVYSRNNKNLSCTTGEVLYQGKNRAFFHKSNYHGTGYYILCAKDKAGNWSKGIKITVIKK